MTAPPARSASLPTGGQIRPITRWGADVMHRPASPVRCYDRELLAVVADMVATMYAADGVGLAACQIGVDLAVFCFDCVDAVGERHTGVICNPTLTLQEAGDRALDEEEEGCLSLPGAFTLSARPDTATVTGFGLDGQPVIFRGDGLLARCLQHETDHTRGVVFGDRLATKARKRLEKAHLKVAADYPPDWPMGMSDASIR
jgi:peptide deformylase